MMNRPVRLDSLLLASAAMGLALAVTAPYRVAQAADVCGAGTTTIVTAQANADNCTLDAGESIDITAAGSIPFTGANPAIDVANGAAAGSITNAGTASTVSAGEHTILIRTNGSLTSGITNSGTLSSGAGSGISFASSGSVDANGITNASGADINGADFGIVLSNTSSITGGISNSGSITSTSNDGIALIGFSTVAGGITNAAGGLIDSGDDGVFLGSGTITGDLVNAGTIDADGDGIFVDTSSTITGSIENSGTITGSINGIHIDDSGVGGITNAAGATIEGGTFSIRIANPDAPITVTNAGLLDGEVQLNNGTLNLNGSSARVDGVISGLGTSTVNVNGDFNSEGAISVGTLAVASSGELTLDNNITATSFTNAGTVAIANGATRTVTGDYSQTGSGALQIGATSDSSFGKLSVSGTADFSAANALHVTIGTGDSFSPGDELLDVVQAGTLTANSVTVTDSSALLGFEGIIDGNTIDLEVANSRSIETIVESGGSGGNSGNAGGTLDDIIADGPSGDMQNIVDALNALPTDQAVENAVKKLLPALNGNHAQGNMVAAQTGATDVVLDRLTRLSGINAGDGQFVDPVAWAKSFFAVTEQGSRGGVSGFDGSTVGSAFGVDGQFSEDVRAGAAISYAQAAIDGRGASVSTVEIDTFQVTGYGTYDIDRKTHLNLLSALGWNANDSRRVIDFGGLNRTAKADYDSWHATADVELVRSYQLNDDLGFMPSVSGTYTYVRAEDYSETGAGAANLNVDDADADSLNFGASGRLIYGLTEGINISSNLGLTYDVLADDDQVTATFQGGGSSFVTEGIDPAPFGVTAGIALELIPETGIDARLAYDVEAREDFRNHKVQLNLRFPF